MPLKARLEAVRPEFLAAPAALMLFLVVLVPLPAPLLDLLLVANIVLAFVLLILAFTLEDHARLSAFPTILLTLTIYRLALNVASTRLILAQGQDFGGLLVRAFGSYVLSGSYAVGIVLFGLLVLIQYLVVNKGSERVAEVAARFRLDALPLKQMGIEARVQDKSLTREEAERELKALQQESDFFGAMDGASKFVMGETMASFAMVAVNFVGGALIGLSKGGQGLGEVLSTFALLTVGDGLVGWVPSMMVALAAGVVVTRTQGEGSLSVRLVREVLQSSAAVGAALAGIGVLMAIFAVFAGVGMGGFGLLALACFGAAAAFLRAEDPAAEGEADRGPVVVELDPGLHAALARAFPAALRPAMEAAAARIREELGLPVEAPALRAGPGLSPGCWRVMVKDLAVGGGTLDPERWLAVHAGEAPGERLPGEADADPLGNRPAMLIAPEAVARAVEAGWQVLDPAEVLGARVSRVLLRAAGELCGLDETRRWLEAAARRYPAVVREVAAAVKPAELQRLLSALLVEGVPIKAAARLLESTARHPGLTGGALAEAVRTDLARAIVEPLRGADGLLRVLVLEPALEAELRESLTAAEDGGEMMAIDPDLAGELLSGLKARAEGMRRRGATPCLLVSRRMRPHLLRLAGREVEGLRVLAYEEAEGVECRVEARLDRFSRPAADDARAAAE